MMKKMNLILAMLILSVGITACESSKKEPETTAVETSAAVETTVEETTEEETTEAIDESAELMKIVTGIWKLTAGIKNGKTTTVEELEAAGDYSGSNGYLVFSDDNKYQLSSDGNVTTGAWSPVDKQSILVGSAEMEYDEETGSLKLTGSDGIVYQFEKISASQNIADVPENKTAPATTEAETEPETEAKADDNEISADFKAAMDEYEAFMDEYVEFMKKYSASSDPTSMMMDYLNYMGKYADMVEKFDKMDDGELNDAELAYYLDVQTRVSKKLLEAY